MGLLDDLSESITNTTRDLGKMVENVSDETIYNTGYARRDWCG